MQVYLVHIVFQKVIHSVMFHFIQVYQKEAPWPSAQTELLMINAYKVNIVVNVSHVFRPRFPLAILSIYVETLKLN